MRVVYAASVSYAIWSVSWLAKMVDQLDCVFVQNTNIHIHIKVFYISETYALREGIEYVLYLRTMWMREWNIINGLWLESNAYGCMVDQCYKLSSTVWLSSFVRTHKFLPSLSVLFPIFFFSVKVSSECIDFIASFDYVQSVLLLLLLHFSRKSIEKQLNWCPDTVFTNESRWSQNLRDNIFYLTFNVDVKK